MNIMADYFAGFGGASTCFVKKPGWRVRRFDNWDSGSPDMTVIDILEAPIEGFPFKPRLAWFSPPCDEFSLAFNAIRPRTIREGGCFEPNMDLAQRTFDIIQQTEPESWVVENVVGSIKFFEPLFGPPRQIIGPYVLFGNFPRLILPDGWEPPKKTDVPPCDLRPRLRAIIPREISQALFDSINNQRTIYDFI